MYGLLDHDLDKPEFEQRIKNGERNARRQPQAVRNTAIGRIQALGNALITIGQKLSDEKPATIRNQPSAG